MGSYTAYTDGRIVVPTDGARAFCGIGGGGAAFASRNSRYMPIDMKPCAKEAGTVPASFWLTNDTAGATHELCDANPAPRGPRKRDHDA